MKVQSADQVSAAAGARNKGLPAYCSQITSQAFASERSAVALPLPLLSLTMLDRLEEYKVAIKTTASVLFLLTSLLLCLSLHLPPFLVPAPVFVTVGSVAALSVWGLLYLVLNSDIAIVTEPPADAG